MRIGMDNFKHPKIDIHGNYNRVYKYTIKNYINKFNGLFMID